MKYIAALALILFVCVINVYSQVSGNIIYKNDDYYSAYKRPQIELPTGNLSLSENAFLIEANVLINAKADEYIATFSLNEEGESINEANQKIEKKIPTFISSLTAIGITKENIFVDFVTQNKIYSYDLNNPSKGPGGRLVVTERLAGFEVKKNIFIRYKTTAQLDKITLIAAKSDIYDLVKVDYIVSNTRTIREQLFDEAIKVINKKETDFINKIGLTISSIKQIHTLKYKALTPSESYQSYQASETNQVTSNYYNEYAFQTARKNKTFFYHPLDSNDFDTVINPVVTEPVVQYTILLRIKYKYDH